MPFSASAGGRKFPNGCGLSDRWKLPAGSEASATARASVSAVAVGTVSLSEPVARIARHLGDGVAADAISVHELRHRNAQVARLDRDVRRVLQRRRLAASLPTATLVMGAAPSAKGPAMTLSRLACAPTSQLP